jgi:single-stranded-DNA-specific exonuclease
VIGIVASRLVERFYRPVVMLTRVNGTVKGSARSIKGFSIYDGLKQCSHLLTRFGGHKYAAGMTLPEENVPTLREELNRIVRESVPEDLLKPEIMVDAPLNLDELSPRFWKILSQFGPFGPENSTPVFQGDDLLVASHPTIVGDGHLKFKVAQNQSAEQKTYDVIGFQKHELLPLVRSHKNQRMPIQMAFSVDLNEWGGRNTLQLKMRDVRTPQADRPAGEIHDTASA